MQNVMAPHLWPVGSEFVLTIKAGNKKWMECESILTSREADPPPMQASADV
jgi:hypothetical protein